MMIYNKRHIINSKLVHYNTQKYPENVHLLSNPQKIDPGGGDSMVSSTTVNFQVITVNACVYIK